MKDINTPWYKFYDGVKEHLDYPDDSLYDLWERSSIRFENNISYNYFGKKASFGEFRNQIESTAKALKTLGVNAGDVVTICMPNTPEAIMTFYAVNKIGAIANMIHPLSAENEIKYYFNISDSKYVVTIDLALNKINNIVNESKIEKIVVVSVADSMPIATKIGYHLTKGRKIKAKLTDKCIRWNRFINNGSSYKGNTKQAGKGEDTAVILYSGGTSGYPKGIELSNYNFNALAIQSIEICQILEPGDKLLAIMPVFHGFGLGICIHSMQYLGGTSIILPQFSASTFDKLLLGYRPNVIAGVPTLYEAMLRNKKLEGKDLSFIKCIISGGDSLSVNLKQKVDEFLHAHNANVQVREGYGLTECVTGSCLTPTNYYREGSIGVPYPDTYYKIINPETMEECPYGEEGEIVISGPTVMKDYLKDPEETAKTLKLHDDGKIWMHTGDAGSMDEDGFIYFKQRIKRLIISSGYNIYPQYIENVIDGLPEVVMSCVIGIPDSYKMQVAKAFIVLKDGIEPSDEILNKIKKHCEKNLAKYSLPAKYEFRKELPKTLVGKVAFKVLMDEEAEKNE